MRATDVEIGDKHALDCGYGVVGKCSPFALRGDGGRVLISERDPICALQACADGFQVVRIARVNDQAGILAIIGHFKIITLVCMQKMKINAFIGSPFFSLAIYSYSCYLSTLFVVFLIPGLFLEVAGAFLNARRAHHLRLRLR